MSFWKNRTTRRNFLIGGGLVLAASSIYGAYEVKEKFFSSTLKPSLPQSPRFDPAHPGVILRRHPYPYKASLTITSDIDGSSPTEFRNVHRYLNTLEETELGRGLGLDIADSCWMVVDTNWEGPVDLSGQSLGNQMSYWSHKEIGNKYAAKDIHVYGKHGWIDSVHSYGDFNRKNENEITFSRSIAEASIREWQDKGLQFTVWIDHGNRCNVQNFGNAGLILPDYQQGDNPASPYYHTDLLIPYGIRYVWNSLQAKDESKFHYPDLLYPITLRDGQRVWGFHRYSCRGRNWKGEVQFLWNPYKLQEQLTAKSLDDLTAQGGFASVAQHFGGATDLYMPFPDEARASLGDLARRHQAGEILVARTSRLLHYNRVNNFLSFQVESQAETTAIVIESVQDPHLGAFKPTPEDLRGITFYCPNPEKTRLFLGQNPIADTLISRNPADHTGQPSLSIRWFPPDTTDYSWSV